MNTNNSHTAHLNTGISMKTFSILQLLGATSSHQSEPFLAIKCYLLQCSKPFLMVLLHIITQKHIILKKDIYNYNIFSVQEQTYRVPCNLSCGKLTKLFEATRTTQETQIQVTASLKSVFQGNMKPVILTPPCHYPGCCHLECPSPTSACDFITHLYATLEFL